MEFEDEMEVAPVSPDAEQPSESYLSMGLGLLVVIIVGILLFNFFASKRSQQTAQQQGNQETSATSSAQLPETHTVETGETLWSISEKYFQSGYNWTDIANANSIVNPESLEAGQVLAIPKVQPILPETGIGDATAPVVSSYTVKENDTLWDIACQVYNDCYAWHKIAEANNVTDPMSLATGSELQIPQ